ncbi:MAG TPA: response regulator transcription factor [Nitrospiria bacterium]|jgi:DNA-binding NarL/FixJ family response regulator
MEHRIHLIVCDRDKKLRERLKELIRIQNDFELIAELTHPEQFKNSKNFIKTDIFIAGLDPNQRYSIQQFFPLLSQGNNIKYFILSDVMQGDLMLRAMHAGIRAFLSKTIRDEELADAIREVFKGGIWFQKKIEVNGTHPKNGKMQDRKYYNGNGLTAQEIRVHEMVRQGLRNKEIAEKLYLSEKTVKCHVHNIFNKLNVTKRTQLMDYSLTSSGL